VLVGVIDRYAIGHTPQGPVRAVIVTAEPTGAQVSLWLSSTILLSLFAQHQPHPGARIGVRYRWSDLDHGYHRWMLIVDRPEALDFSPLGGEASDEAPWPTLVTTSFTLVANEADLIQRREHLAAHTL